jgi:pyridoxine 5-phosphate synthase
MIELGVNIDHVATLRQARRTYEPDPVWAAVEAHLGGADGITVHLREDRRHIQDEDVRRLRELVNIKLNLEMAATPEMLGIACRVKPEMAMLVPEGRHEITTEGGSTSRDRKRSCATSSQRCADAGIVTSVFIDADVRRSRPRRASARACAKCTPGRTRTRFTPRAATESAAWSPSSTASARRARRSRALGMRFNAGHALTYFNVQLVAALHGVRELHIGHAIVSRAMFTGLREAVRQMKALMRRRPSETRSRGAGRGRHQSRRWGSRATHAPARRRRHPVLAELREHGAA